MKNIEGFDGYFVDKRGNVFSNRFGKMKKMKVSLRKDGYEKVAITKSKIAYHKKVHRLVAQAFIPNPECKPNINHKNGKKNDNRCCNLEWCTQKENIKHSIDTGLRKVKYKIKSI